MLRLTLLAVLAISAQQSFADEPDAIVGGQPAAPGEFPHQCSLNLDNYHICGCSILSPNQVLTAAHCLQDIVEPPYTELRILTGAIDAYAGKPHAVKTARIHPGYNPSQSWINDVAVITLRTPIQYNSYTRPIALASSAPVGGTQCVFSGWGRISTNGPTSRQLLKMRTAIVGNSQCQSYHSLTIYQSQVCALTGEGVGACNGDSGGPLVCNGQQVGIASWVSPCARGLPDVYTSVYHHRNFIEAAKQDI